MTVPQANVQPGQATALVAMTPTSNDSACLLKTAACSCNPMQYYLKVHFPLPVAKSLLLQLRQLGII